jgi:hypothetical protein
MAKSSMPGSHEELECRRDDEQAHVDQEHRFAAEFVGGPTSERRADKDAEQGGCGDHADPQRRQT